MVNGWFWTSFNSWNLVMFCKTKTEVFNTSRVLFEMCMIVSQCCAAMLLFQNRIKYLTVGMGFIFTHNI